MTLPPARSERCHQKAQLPQGSLGLYVAFIDLTKAFDTVSRDGLWKILVRLGCPLKVLTILQQLREGQMAR